VVRREPDGALVTSVAQVAPGQALSIRVADGSFAAVAGARDQAIRADVVPAAAEDGARRPRPPRGDATPAVEERE
jgi:hypothetical protein